MLKLTDNDYIVMNKTEKDHNMKYLENNMSIFSKLGEYKNFEDYIYYETSYDEFFYIKKYKLFIDKNKKIIFNSNFIFQNYWYIKNKINEIIIYINSIDINNITINENNQIITIQSWMETYGHFLDEITTLYYFNNNFNITNNIKILYNYPEINVYNNSNYKLIDKYLFENNIINVNKCDDILKFNKLYLINNAYNDPTFHKFPLLSTHLILSKIQKYNIIYPKKMFISRKHGWTTNRLFENFNEIEQLFIQNNYTSIYPEDIELDLYINYLYNAEIVFLTWGSALTNMIFLRPNTNVIILKSKAYESESIYIFSKIIKNYKINIIKIISETTKNYINELKLII